MDTKFVTLGKLLNSVGQFPTYKMKLHSFLVQVICKPSHRPSSLWLVPGRNHLSCDAHTEVPDADTGLESHGLTFSSPSLRQDLWLNLRM